MKYFNINEFDSPDKPGSGELMKMDFLIQLEQARLSSNTPFIINSGYRTIKHNSKIKGSPTSSHLIGRAADIKCTNPVDRINIIKGLIQAGFTRIGVADNFIHVDNDKSKGNALWIY